MIDYFSKKSAKDFKNTKKFWKFYRDSIKIRSDKSGSTVPTNIIKDGIEISDQTELAEIFNAHFTSIGSCSLSSSDKCTRFIKSHFNDLKNRNVFTTDIDGFNFTRFSKRRSC